MSRLTACLPALLLLSACDTVVSGENGVLRFRFDADEALLPASFNTPIGTGLAARVQVFIDPDDTGPAGNEAANVIDASSSDAAVVVVVATAGNEITLLAKTAGSAEIQVQSVRGEDTFVVSVVDVATADVSHPGVLVPDNPPSKGIVGGTARFSVRLEDAAGKQVLGFGAVPVTTAPDGAATLLDGEEIGYLAVKFAVAGVATVTGLNDEPLTLDLISDDEVTGLSLAGFEPFEGGNTLEVGKSTAAVLRGVTDAGDRVVGVASLATVVSVDSDICTIAPNLNLGEGAYTIVAVAPGDCHISATLGARQVQHTLQVAP